MESKTTKEEIPFDLSKALIVIENDADLNEMFRTKYGTDYQLAHTLIKTGGIKPQAEKYIKGIFEKIILERTSLKNAYLSIGNKEIKEHTGTDKAQLMALATNKKRFGLRAIEDDVESNFDGKPQQIHKTATRVQNLKKIFSRLETKTFNERFEKPTLSDSELRELSGAIDTFEKKINSILKPKNKK